MRPSLVTAKSLELTGAMTKCVFWKDRCQITNDVGHQKIQKKQKVLIDLCKLLLNNI